ncbi:adenylate kinase [Nematocida displodere]|uniref:Adenylate kinase isoenzyme 6 homolog n=1 Tax=Nematocida displodere TaxID=1805483 RepID=A0A177ECL8_9MICR|nr:adenylate kinase [Nematocida displodere]
MAPMGKRVLVTGTPGVGKTTFTKYLAEKTGFRVVELSTFIKKHRLFEGACKKYDTLVYSPETVQRFLKRKMKSKHSYIIDTHDPETVSNIEYDVVVVLSCDTSILGARYDERGYNQEKITENLEVEIMDIVYNDVIDFVCKTPEEEKDVVRIPTNNKKEILSLDSIFAILSSTAPWQRLGLGQG